MRFSVYAGLLFLLCGSCENKKNPLIFSYDYESAKGWSAIQLEKGIAHSGDYSEKLTPEIEYSHGLSLALAQADTIRPRKIDITVWANALSLNAPVLLVCDVYVPGAEIRRLKYSTKDLQPLLQSSGWKKCNLLVDLTEIPANEPAFVKVYVWNNQKQTLWIDDLNIKFIK
jgi:hypothetical protein